MVVSTSLWNIASLAHLLCLHINHFSATNNVPYFEHYTRCMCDVCYTYDMFKVWMSDCAWMPCYAAAKVVLHVDTLMLVDNHHSLFIDRFLCRGETASLSAAQLSSPGQSVQRHRGRQEVLHGQHRHTHLLFHSSVV